MPKIFAFISSTNSVNWDNTKAAVSANATKFAEGFHDFGAGSEAKATCPGCKRTLPLAIFALDHIRPQSRYTPSSLGLMSNADLALYTSAGCARVNGTDGSVAGSVTGGVMKVQSGSIYNPKIALVQAAELWKNDLGNLQLLCSICNSSKKDKTWTEWGKLETDAKPLSAKL